jgi:hypothetical protein
MLIRNIDQLLDFTGNITGTKSFEEVKPSMEWGEEFMLVPAIGQAMYDRVNEVAGGVPGIMDAGSGSGSAGLPDGPVSITSEADALILLRKCARVVAHYTLFDYVTISDSRVTAQGLQIIETDTHKTAYEYQKRDRKKYHSEKADQALDALLSFLEDNKLKYPEWANNTQVYTQTKSLLINNTREFHEIVDIGSSRRTFMALKGSIKDVEALRIRPALGETIYAALLGFNVRAGNSTLSRLLQIVAAAVANLAMADALPSLIFRIAGETITIATYNPIPEKERDQFTKVVAKIIESRTQKGNSYLEDAVRFVKSNPDLLLMSPYADDAAQNGGIYPNYADKKHFIGF